jgi:hypothetical protein
MDTTAETPDKQPAKADRRTRWIAAAAAAATVVGIGVVVALSRNEGKFSGSVPSGGGRTLDQVINVREHQRQQAFGPNYSKHRDIFVPTHHRGLARAA